MEVALVFVKSATRTTPFQQSASYYKVEKVQKCEPSTRLTTAVRKDISLHSQVRSRRATLLPVAEYNE